MTENQDEALALARRVQLAEEALAMLPALRDICLGGGSVEAAIKRAMPILARIDGDDSDLAEAADGDFCRACERPSIDCSREPCPAVIEDRGED